MQNEALLLTNEDGEYCIVTYDNDKETWEKVTLFKSTGQFVLYSQENPDGDMLPIPLDPEVITALGSVDKILYVNLDSETAEPMEEGWLPFSVQD